MNKQQSVKLAKKIVIAMALGIIVGLILNVLPNDYYIETYLIDGVLEIIGKIFIAILTMLVVPIVFVSLVSGTCHLGDIKKFGGLAFKTLGLYLLTTVIAISLWLFFATVFKIGDNSQLSTNANFIISAAPSLKEVILNIIPNNPFAALAKGDMLQVIIFSILLGSAIALSGEHGKNIASLFIHVNEVMMKLINMDGTAIMQGVATVFIAQAYNIHLSFLEYLIVILMATLASIGTAGVPSVGLITLAMILKQVGLPIKGIAMIIGIDRLLDMVRTAVNITGDSAVACVVGKFEKELNLKTYYE